MFRKSIQRTSFILLLVLFLQIMTPITSLATDVRKINNEDIAVELEDVIVTTIDKGSIAIIKTYSKNGTLLEEIIIDRGNLQNYKVLNYTEKKNNKPVERTINFEEKFGLTPNTNIIKDDNISLKNEYDLNRAYEYTIGRSTVKSHSPISNFTTYYVDVSYKYSSSWDSDQYLLKSGQYAAGEAIAMLIGLFNFSAKTGSNLLGALVGWGVAKIVGNVYNIATNVYLNADNRDFDVIGRDSRDPEYTVGTLYGTEWQITHRGSYYGKTFYDGVNLDDWGDKTITYSLIREMYPGLYYEMEVISER